MRYIIVSILLVFATNLQADWISMAKRDRVFSKNGHVIAYDKVEHLVRSATCSYLLKKYVFKSGKASDDNKVFFITLGGDLLWELRDGIVQHKGDGISIWDIVFGTLGNMIIVSIRL
jgi:hypothetical protein